MHLRVVTINVQNDEGNLRRMELLNAELRRLEPDLVSPRWPHRVVEVLDLRPAGAMDVPWATVAAIVPLPDEGDLLFSSATASWRLEAESVRGREAMALADLDARHRTDLPTIIAGDFNADPDAASIRYLTGRQSLAGRSVLYHDAWEVGGNGPGHTWSVDNPNAAAQIGQIVRQPGHRRRIDSSSPAPGTHIPMPTAKLSPPPWPSTNPVTAYGRATTSASSPTLTSARTSDGPMEECRAGQERKTEPILGQRCRLKAHPQLALEGGTAARKRSR